LFPGFQTFPEGQIIAFALVLMRVIAFIVSWPIFGSNLVSVQVKVLLSITLTMIVFPTVGFQNVNLIQINEQLILLTFREICIGLFLGYLLRFIFFSIQIAGEIMGTSTGLASAQLYNPTMGSQGNVLDQYHLVLATILTLTLNGHHMFIEGLVKSFEMAPVSAVGLNTQAFASISLIVKDTFIMGIKMAAPIMVSMFIINITMGLIGRAVPQMNVMMTGMQVTILAGLFVILVSTPLFVEEVSQLLQIMSEHVFATMKVI
jgi:flagellar biosynthesis protein FliR